MSISALQNCITHCDTILVVVLFGNVYFLSDNRNHAEIISKTEKFSNFIVG